MKKLLVGLLAFGSLSAYAGLSCETTKGAKASVKLNANTIEICIGDSLDVDCNMDHYQGALKAKSSTMVTFIQPGNVQKVGVTINVPTSFINAVKTNQKGSVPGRVEVLKDGSFGFGKLIECSND